MKGRRGNIIHIKRVRADERVVKTRDVDPPPVCRTCTDYFQACKSIRMVQDKAKAPTSRDKIPRSCVYACAN